MLIKNHGKATFIAKMASHFGYAKYSPTAMVPKEVFLKLANGFYKLYFNGY